MFNYRDTDATEKMDNQMIKLLFIGDLRDEISVKAANTAQIFRFESVAQWYVDIFLISCKNIHN